MIPFVSSKSGYMIIYLQLFDHNVKVTTVQLEKMITEGSNAASAEIDRVSTLEMCRIINDEDKNIPLAVERVLPDIAAAIDIYPHPGSGGGRLIYLGAGTSGRLGFWMPANVRRPTA